MRSNTKTFEMYPMIIYLNFILAYILIMNLYAIILNLISLFHTQNIIHFQYMPSSINVSINRTAHAIMFRYLVMTLC